MEPPSPSPAGWRIVAILGALGATGIDAALLAVALGGLSALAAHPRALALLLVWFAGALLLALARPVRPVEGTRQKADALRILALLVLPLATPPLSAWGERFRYAMIPGGDARGWLGVAITAAGLGLRVAAMRQLGSRFHPTIAIVPGHELATEGLYARMRHPGYAGTLLAAAGAVLTFGSALGLIPLALMAIVLAARVGDEERALESHFGDAWRAYRARTGAILPRIRG
jgi:protein-S-isoprenylcysteine O-methyltransferase Ste14